MSRHQPETSNLFQSGIVLDISKPSTNLDSKKRRRLTTAKTKRGAAFFVSRFSISAVSVAIIRTPDLPQQSIY